MKHTPNPEHFTTLQRAWTERADTLRALRAEAERRYQDVTYAPSRVRQHIDRAERAERKAQNKFCDYLEAISPRDWRSGVPITYLRERLTFADATTAGALSTVPPPAWGYTDHEARAFAAPVRIGADRNDTRRDLLPGRRPGLPGR